MEKLSGRRSVQCHKIFLPERKDRYMNSRNRFRRQNKKIVSFMVLFPFLCSGLIELFHFPSAVKYVVDVCACILLLTMMFKRRPYISLKGNIIKYWILLFAVYVSCNYIASYQSPVYFLWGVRNYFRFYIFFMACVYYLHSKDLDKLFRMMSVIYYFHVFIVLVQYFVLGIEQDNLGGIFGTQSGCNGWVNIFQVIIVTYSILRYLNKEKSMGICVMDCGSALVIAALAELKFFYIEFVLIVVMAVLITDFSWKKVIIIIGAAFGVVLSVVVLVRIFPYWADKMSIKSVLEMASLEQGYTMIGDMNRLTFFSRSRNLFLKTPGKIMFGLGIGNCDYSDSFLFLTTPFYQKYNLLHYTWLSTAFMLLENGVVGLIFYFGFFVVTAIHSFLYAKGRKRNKTYVQLTIIISIISILIGMYNVSLRMECGYMIFFVLSLPYVIRKDEIFEKRFIESKVELMMIDDSMEMDYGY